MLDRIYAEVMEEKNKKGMKKALSILKSLCYNIRDSRIRR